MLSAALLSVTLVATPPADDGPHVHTLRHEWLLDGSVAAAGMATWFATEAWKSQLAPSYCRWCDRRSDGTDVLNTLDAWGRGIRLKPSDQPTADTLSSVIAFGLLPVGVIALDFVISHHDLVPRQVLATDISIIAESAILAVLLDQTMKYIVGRARPYAHALTIAQEEVLTDRDAFLSFFSGHSTFVFALVVAAGTVAHLRGYRWEWLVWAIALPVAAVVPVLRMAADKHYLTDVLTGSAIGAAFGVGVPELFHARIEEAHVDARVGLGPGGLALTGTF